MKAPPKVDKTLYWLSLFLDLVGIVLAATLSISFAAAVFLYGLISKAYSHPKIRLKKYPCLSFGIVFLFQGAFVFWTSIMAVSDTGFQENLDERFLIGGLICACLIGASYPLTQVYQHEEDKRRGDRTLSLLLGVRGSFLFAALLFVAAVFAMFYYWQLKHTPENFLLFLCFLLPAVVYFGYWFWKAEKDRSQANFKHMTIMTTLSGSMMLAYFIIVLIRNF